MYVYSIYIYIYAHICIYIYMLTAHEDAGVRCSALDALRAFAELGEKMVIVMIMKTVINN